MAPASLRRIATSLHPIHASRIIAPRSFPHATAPRIFALATTIPPDPCRAFSSSAPDDTNRADDGARVVPSRRVSWTMGPGQGPVPSLEGTEADRSSTLWPGMYHSPVTAALWQARASIRERDGKHGAGACPQAELISKSPSMSRTSVSYGFARDAILREQYRNPWNGCRIGKLLEDLDALAGTIAMKVCLWFEFFLFVILTILPYLRRMESQTSLFFFMDDLKYHFGLVEMKSKYHSIFHFVFSSG